jgi:hypothetical protein
MASSSRSSKHAFGESLAGPSTASTSSSPGGGFEILEWHPAYQSCQRYFLDVSQHNAGTQAVAAFMNIQLPFQWATNSLMNASGQPMPGTGPYPHDWNRPGGPVAAAAAGGRGQSGPLAWVSLVPYIRRMVVTGFDKEAILRGFFGDDWQRGVGPLHESERRNYLFTTKSVGWAKTKMQYDMSPQETVPFMKPLEDVTLQEIKAAEKTWSQWLMMEDWMIGPHAPDDMDEGSKDAS